MAADPDVTMPDSLRGVLVPPSNGEGKKVSGAQRRKLAKEADEAQAREAQQTAAERAKAKRRRIEGLVESMGQGLDLVHAMADLPVTPEESRQVSAATVAAVELTWPGYLEKAGPALAWAELIGVVAKVYGAAYVRKMQAAADVVADAEGASA